MITAIDTNVFIALWDEDPALSEAAQTALDGSLVVAAPVFAELIAAPGRTEAFVSSFLEKTELRLIGIWVSRFGVLRGGRSSLTRDANSAIRAPDVFLLTS